MRLLLLSLVPVAGLAGVVGVRHFEPQPEAELAHVSRAQEIRSIAIDGRGLPMASLRELLSTHAGEQVDTAKLTHDREALEQELVDRGYYAAHVTNAQVSYDANGGAFITFRVEQGPQFRVRSVIVTGATPKDAGVLAFEAGEIATADRIQLARATLADRLESRGKHLTVAANVRADDEAAVVDIELSAH
ncbi:MAG TPA: POTRA domain-containing protein [Kofleriaceae bacterium]|nr:POTRA domain-containing protein [Kofleriaceae bacterium]